MGELRKSPPLRFYTMGNSVLAGLLIFARANEHEALAEVRSRSCRSAMKNRKSESERGL